MFKRKVSIHEKLPKQKVKNIKFLYIVIDSESKIHYEYNNKGHVVLPIHWSEMNPKRILKNLPNNLVRKCVSPKKNIAGVLQLWMYYKEDYVYARVKAVGVLEQYQRQGFMTKLFKAMDSFCRHQGVKFVESETRVIPEKVKRKQGFVPSRSEHWWHRLDQWVSRTTSYVKWYD
jgi:hypothetical protein